MFLKSDSKCQLPVVDQQGYKEKSGIDIDARRRLKLVCVDICDCKQRYNGGSSAYLVQSSRHYLPQPCQLHDEGPIYALELVSMGSFRPLRQSQRAALIACTITHLPSFLPLLSSHVLHSRTPCRGASREVDPTL
jgi:hypothetical protein